MEFPRIKRLPPYVLAEVVELKHRARVAGEDIIDLGMGNPDGATPPHIVQKLVEAAAKAPNHRYSLSKGLPKLRLAMANWYRRRFGVELDPETEVCATIGAKEGLALLNGTQFSTAYALAALFETENLYRAALITGALSTDAARGSDAPFDPRIHQLRRHAGQIEAAGALRRLMAGSAIRASHLVGDERVQDPYCLRCQPQVMGAVLDILRQAATTLATEANGVTDNPLIFAETEEALSGGNFHGEPVAFAADLIALAICEIGSLAERRIAMLVDPALSGLPAFLTPRPGLNSGFMIPQVTAAALVSENKQRAYPASVDSIPTSANQEDHVSMAAHGARRLLGMAENGCSIVGIELLAAAQGCDFHRPLASSASPRIRGRPDNNTVITGVLPSLAFLINALSSGDNRKSFRSPAVSA